MRTAGATGTYQIRDGTNVTRGADGTLNPIDPATGLPTRGNIAETFEFRAIDREPAHAVRPAVQLRRAARARRQHDARSALRRQQGQQAARGARVQPGLRPERRRRRRTTSSSGSTRRTSRPAAPTARSTPARRRASAGLGRAFGFPNTSLGGMIDYNLANAAGAVIGFEARDADPRLQHSRGGAARQHRAGRSTTRCSSASSKRMSHGVQFNLAYTLLAVEGHELGRSRAARPAAASRTCPNAGFVGAGQPARTSTPTTRCRTSIGRTASAAAWSWDLPGRGAARRLPAVGLRAAAVRACRTRSTRRSPSWATRSQYGDLVRGSGGIYRLGFGRPSLCGSLDELRQAGDDPTEAAFNKSVLCSPIDSGGRLSGQPGLRQSRPQRAARLLAAPRRPEPRQELPVRAAAGTSSCGGTSSTSSTP